MSDSQSLLSRSFGVLRKLLLSTLVGLVVLSLFEGAASLWINASTSQLVVVLSEQSHSRYDTELGWSHEPGTVLDDHYGEGRSITINAQGLRALEEYTQQVPDGRYRILFAGDSFTMGFGVDDHDTFEARLEALCPAVQTVNMGMGGYGLDQAWLWYQRDGGRFDADLLVFTFIDADFFRTTMTEFVGYPKPRLEVRGGELVTTNVPVPRAFGRSSFTRRLQTFVHDTAIARLARGESAEPTLDESATADVADASVEMYDRAEHILDAARALAAERGQRFLMMYLPTKKLAYMKQRTTISKWVRTYARRKDVPLLDLMEAFDDVPLTELVDDVYLPDNHFDVRGNTTIAEKLLEELLTNVPDFPGCETRR